MDLKQKLADDLKIAMKSGNLIQKTTIRTLLSEIRKAEIDSKSELTNEEVLNVISKQAKQRRDSIEQYQKAGRVDLLEQEQQELTVIGAYLPQQLSDDEITERAKAVILELQATNMKAMGSVMKHLTSELKGVADGKRISKIVRELLAQ